MKNACFQIQIVSDTEFVLSRAGDGWEAMFHSVKEALDYMDGLLSDGEGDVTVFDAGGVRFSRVVC